MKISIFLERKNKKLDLAVKKGDNLSSIMKRLNINPVAYISTVNGELVTEDYLLKDNDKVEIFSVVSGG